MKNSFTKYSVVFLLFFTFFVKAQTIPELKNKLQNNKIPAESSKIESDLGRLYFAESDFVTAQNFFFSSLKSAEKISNQHLIASACNNIAVTYMETENYLQAIEYAKKSIEIQKKQKDHKGLADAYNTLATVYYMQEKDDLSMQYFLESIKEREIIKDSAGLFAGYKNLGANLFEIGKKEEAAKYIEKSLLYISKKTDTLKWLGAYTTLIKTNFEIGKMDKAKKYIQLANPYTQNSKLYNKLEDYYSATSEYYEKEGDTKAAFINFKLYAKFRDSVISTNKNEQLTELNVKYETEKKQNLINQQQFELKQKNNWLIFSGILFLISFIAAYFIYKNYRHKQNRKLQTEIFRQQEIESRALFEGEQQERIRIARDLHDGVGQMLSLVKMNLSTIENEDLVTKKTINLVDKTIDEVRNVSHNLIPEELNFGIFSALENLAEKVNSSGKTKMEVEISQEIKSMKLTLQNELSIYRIVQEVVNNMIKHADASLIHLSVNQTNQSILIAIKDNGIGFGVNTIDNSKGIGWKNIKARIHLLEGKINIKSEKLSGTQIEITLPGNGEK